MLPLSGVLEKVAPIVYTDRLSQKGRRIDARAFGKGHVTAHLLQIDRLTVASKQSLLVYLSLSHPLQIV